MHLFCMYVMMYVQIWNSTWSIANIQHLTSAKEFEASIPVKYFKTILYKDSCPKEMTVEICKVVPLKKFSKKKKERKNSPASHLQGTKRCSTQIEAETANSQTVLLEVR